MFHNFKIAFRSLSKNRLYSIISIVGLSVSLAACSFILLWIQDEKSYDRFHKNADEIYMGITHFTNDGKVQTVEVTSGLFAVEAKEHFPEVKSYCRIRSFRTGYVLAEGINTGEKEVFVTDSTFFSFFNFPVITGFSQNLFQQPDEVVISESLAREMFGNDYPIGKTISIMESEEKTYHVVAVMKDFPANTCLRHADLIIHWKSEPDKIYLDYGIWNGWGSCEFFSFIRLQKGTDVNQLAKEVTNLQTGDRSSRHFTLQPMVNLHLYTLEGEPAGIKTIWIFTWIACAILVIACINYVNLVTARSSKKNREVGLKKVFGARKVKLFFQLMTEAVILFLIAMAVAVFLNVLLTEVFNQLSGKGFSFKWNDWNILMLYGSMFFAVIIFAGIYPALSLSSFKLLNMLQGKLTNKGNTIFRKSLVIAQFAASVILIAATITLESQLGYIRRKNLGFDQKHVFTCQMRNMAGHYETIKQELMQNSFIQSVSGASERILDVQASNRTISWEGKITEGSVSYYRLYVDSTFIDDMSIVFTAGSGFGPGEEIQYIINETAAKTMGLTEPIVGKWMVADYGIRGTIVGVVKDFHFHNLYKKISPLVIFHSQNWANTLYVHTTAKDAERAIAAVRKLWKEYNPKYTFDYSFMDESFERLYHSDIRTGRLFMTFSLIAILISCLGLFGLAAYTAETKTKEIGIRKILGASVSNIVSMLSKEFLILVGIAMLIAFPLAYYWLDGLLQDYAYRINLGWWIFALAGIITILLTLITVGWQAMKAATANPVTAIKSE